MAAKRSPSDLRVSSAAWPNANRRQRYFVPATRSPLLDFDECELADVVKKTISMPPEAAQLAAEFILVEGITGERFLNLTGSELLMLASEKSLIAEGFHRLQVSPPECLGVFLPVKSCYLAIVDQFDCLEDAIHGAKTNQAPNFCGNSKESENTKAHAVVASMTSQHHPTWEKSWTIQAIPNFPPHNYQASVIFLVLFSMLWAYVYFA